MIIIKTFAKSILIYCFNLHFLDACEVKCLFTRLLHLHFSGMPLCRGVWLEENLSLEILLKLLQWSGLIPLYNAFLGKDPNSRNLAGGTISPSPFLPLDGTSLLG